MDRFREIIRISKEKNISLKYLHRREFETVFHSDKPIDSCSVHYPEEIEATQGILASVSDYNYSDLETAVKKDFNDRSILVMLDGVTDVGNFGSILRNCSAFNVDGIIVPKNRSVSPGRRVSKISSGALEEARIYSVVNLVNTIKKLKESGFWVYGTAPDQDDKEVQDAAKMDFIFPAVFIFGSEQKGMGNLVRKNCDALVKIEHTGEMQSLNVSVTAGILLYIIRQFEKGLKFQVERIIYN